MSSKPEKGLAVGVAGAFAQLEKVNGAPAWLATLRRQACARYEQLGFPTLADEDWRFTNLAPLLKLPFKPALQPRVTPLAPDTCDRFTFAGLPGTQLVFLDGHFVPALSRTSEARDGIGIQPLSRALAQHGDRVKPHLEAAAAHWEDGFTALNAAFFQDGAFIFIPDGGEVAEPVNLLFLSSAQEAGTTSTPRNLIVAGARSRLTVVESHVSLGRAATWTNAATQFVVGDDAVVEHCKFQDESGEAFHIAHLHSQLGRNVNFTSHSIVTGARLSRNNIRTVLGGEGIEAILNGVYLTAGEQLADHHMIVDHAQPHCASHEYFNGILDGRSRGVFHGRILVRPGAQKTDAKQTNKNLLLSDEATANTKPQLEIYADDVKCTHGATIGQLNDESIFYCRARGIGRETARRMLIHAFAGEIIARVRCDAVREELDRLIWDRLEANPHVAADR